MSTLRAPAPAAARVLGSADEALAVAARLAESLAPGSTERDRSGVIPWTELAELDWSGLLGITIPAEHGGADLPPAVLAEVVRRIAASDPAIAQIPQAHFLYIDVLRLVGTGGQRARIYSEVLGGARMGSALAERGARHAQDLRTRLVAGPAGPVLRGAKHYCTGAASARWIGVSALDDRDRLVLVLVRRDGPGVTVDEEWHAMGQRATVSSATILDDAPVDPGLVVDYGRAFEGPQLLGARAQLVHAAIEAGIAAGALADAREFVCTRARPFFEAVNGGWAERAADDPHTIRRIGRLATQVRAAEGMLAWAAGVLTEIGPEPRDADEAARGSLAVAQAKAFCSEVAVFVASDLFALSGASGADARLGLDRHWRNARTHSVHDPVDWKYHHVGAHLLSGTLPPNHGQL